MPPIPFYLVFLTIVFVVLPAIAAILLRYILYQHLLFLEARVRRLLDGQSRGQQPKIVEQLELRFAEASKNLEEVNTAALIDRIYSYQKIGFLSCEQIDYFCRLLPNLLLAFGLLGTFLGITINLGSLSKTIAQTNATDVNSLVAQLQVPLEGMGIAFTTSLTGLFFSAFLTVFNLVYNTSLAKFRLISSLEDYLDNIYQPTIPGHTRLDKAVDRLVTEFSGFLYRFGDTVRSAVESSLGSKIQEIVQANKKANDLAIQVYEGFQISSTTIARSADDLENAIANFGNIISDMGANAQKFELAAKTLDESQFPERIADAIANFNSSQEQFARSTSIIAESVQSITTLLNQLRRSSQQLVSVEEEISSINQISAQALQLHQNNQQSLTQILAQIQLTGNGENLQKIEQDLQALVESMRNYTEGVSLGIQSLGDRLAETMITNADNSQSYSNATLENIEQSVKHLNDIKYEIYRLRQTLEKPIKDRSIDESKLDEIVDKLNKI